MLIAGLTLRVRELKVRAERVVVFVCLSVEEVEFIAPDLEYAAVFCGGFAGSEVGRWEKFVEAAASSFRTCTRVSMPSAMIEKAARMPYRMKMPS